MGEQSVPDDWFELGSNDRAEGCLLNETAALCVAGEPLIESAPAVRSDQFY